MSNSPFTSNFVAKVEVPLLPYMAARRPGRSTEEDTSAGLLVREGVYHTPRFGLAVGSRVRHYPSTECLVTDSTAVSEVKKNV